MFYKVDFLVLQLFRQFTVRIEIEDKMRTMTARFLNSKNIPFDFPSIIHLDNQWLRIQCSITLSRIFSAKISRRVK